MPGDFSVIADPASGAAIVAGTRVAMSAAESASANGAFRFGGPGGRVLRPLTLGERTEFVSAAAALPSARDTVAAAILAAATLEHGAGETSLMEVLAMWLAGAAFDAPDFMETTLLVARGAGWPPHELFTAPAREVDRLAVHLDEQRRASEWKSLVFEEAPAETIDAVRARFAERLLRRSASAAVEEQSPEERESKSLAVPERERPETWSLPGRTATAFASEPTLPRQHATPIAQQQASTTPSRDLDGTPIEEAAPSPALTTSPGHVEPRPPIHTRTPSVRGVRVIIPREERSRPTRATTHTNAIAATEQRPALAFSIRQPRLGGARGGATEIAHPTTPPPIVRTAGTAQPLSKASAPLPQSGSAAHAMAEAVATSVSVAREERAVLHLEPQHETRFPDRAVATSPQFNAAHLTAPHADDLAAILASLLDDEADLRGVER